MAEATRPRTKPQHRGLPDEIVIWEILLRCRAVCRGWRLATSTRDLLLAHHRRQLSLPIIFGSKYIDGGENILILDHRAANAKLQPIARLDDTFYLKASCDGLLILSKFYKSGGTCFYLVCNPVTRQHALLRQLSGFSLLGMYMHRPTGEYRLLLHGRSHRQSTVGHLLNKAQIGCHVLTLGSDQPPRYICAQKPPSFSSCRSTALVRDSLHWYLVEQRELVLVFNTTSESFWHMRAPVVSRKSYIFEMDDTLGIYSRDNAMSIVDIWVLQNYESEVWDCKYRVKLPIAKISWQLGWWTDLWDVRVLSVNSDILLMVLYSRCVCYVDTNGKLVASFLRDGQNLYACQCRLKQTLVQHTFFTALEGYAVNTSPFGC